MKFLITGGAGYIGANLTNYLLLCGYDVLVLDNLEIGEKNSVPQKAKLYIGDLKNRKNIKKVFKDNKIDAVFHLAAYSSVQESMKYPYRYFRNNVDSTINILETMVEFGIKYIVFSSSASVYGIAKEIPISESHSLNPKNVYGQTKKMSEEIILWYDSIYNVKFACLRCFNVAGADFGIGDNSGKKTHLIPLAIGAAIENKSHFSIFGGNYQTKDKTAIRDYIHVTDISEANLLSLKYIMRKEESEVFNLGSERGKSVNDVIKTVEKISGKKFVISVKKRRKGDTPILIANCSKAKRLLGWKPKRDFEEIVKSSYKWQKKSGFE